MQLCAEKGHAARSEAAGSTAAGKTQQGNAQIPLRHLRQMPQAAVQQADGLRIGALLRGEHGGGSALAAEGVVNVAHGHHLCLPQLRQDVFHTDMGNAPQRPAHRNEGVTRFIQKLHAQRRRSAAAAVVGGAAAQTQHDPLGAVLQRVGYELPHAVGGGVRHTPVFAYQRQTGGSGHLHHGCHAVGKQTVAGGYAPSVGILAGGADPLPAYGGEKRVHGALAAVRHGKGAHGGLRLQPADFPGNNGADLRRGQRAFEGIRYQNVLAHGRPSCAYCAAL